MKRTLYTYAQLDHALVALGFTRHELEESRYVYANKPLDAFIILPEYKMSEQIMLHHLLLAQRTVIEKGITDEAEWDCLLHTALPNQGATA